MKSPLFTTLRDWIVFLLGVTWGYLFCLYRSNRKNIMPWLKKNVRLDIDKKEYRGKFPIRIHDIKQRPPKKHIERTLFPPPHAGGNPGNEKYQWAFTELIERRNLTNPEAWEEYKMQFPNPIYDKDAIIEQNDRENFYKAMDRKKAKKRDKTTRR